MRVWILLVSLMVVAINIEAMERIISLIMEEEFPITKKSQ